MELFGLEIKRSGHVRAAEPTVGPIAAATQETKPSIPLQSAHPRAVLGDSGTRGLHGIITEEYNSQLQGIAGIRVYEEMRKSDGTVRAAILACTLPIRRAEWFIKPASDSAEDMKVRDFVEQALFEWIEDMTWDDILRQALLMCSFGVMLFEKVYTIKEWEGKEYVTLKKLAPRLPKSIQQWELIDGTFGIQQIRQDGVQAQIPGSKLLIFVNEREGDNWWGTSMLRAAYKHWYHKNTFYQIDAIAFERQAVGIPVLKMPKGYTANDEKKAVTTLRNLRASETAYMIIPEGYNFEFADMGSHTTRDPQNSINHHNKEILMSVLAQFIELGGTKSGSGSHALSQDHSDLFLKGVEAVANTVRDTINKDQIKELVDLNFNGVQNYPTLDYNNISRVDMQAFGTAFSALVTAGAITVTDDDQQWVRAAMGLPPRSQEDIDADNAEDEAEPDAVPGAANVKTDNTNVNDAQPAADAAVDEAAGAAEDKPNDKAQKAKTDKAAKDAKPKPAKKAKAAASAAGIELPRRFSDGKGFMSWRPLTMAEDKVSWAVIQATMDQMEADFTEEAKALLTDAKDTFMSKLRDAIENGDQAAITALELTFVKDYKKLVQDAMQKAYVYGKNNAAKEMGLDAPANNADSLATIRLVAQAVAEKAAQDLETKAKLAAGNALKNDTPELQAAGQIDAQLDTAIAKSVEDTGGWLVGQSINVGRNDVFERNRDLIYALQRSEILDKKTCNFCLSMDGLVITPDDDWATSDTFHSRCRGIWVEINADETDPPEVTGIPSEVGDYYGGQTNSLIQPPRPIVREDSPAAKYLKKRDANKQ